MDLLLDPFAAGFTQRALIAGLLVAITCATVGVWVVLRSLAFMGDALAHGVIPGIALAALLGVDLTIGAALAALVTVGGISFVTNHSGLPEDTSTGLLFVGMLSLGVMIISRSGSFATDVTSFLFGDVLGVSTEDLVLQAVAAAIALLEPAGTALTVRMRAHNYSADVTTQYTIQTEGIIRRRRRLALGEVAAVEVPNEVF